MSSIETAALIKEVKKMSHKNKLAAHLESKLQGSFISTSFIISALIYCLASILKIKNQI